MKHPLVDVVGHQTYPAYLTNAPRLRPIPLPAADALDDMQRGQAIAYRYSAQSRQRYAGGRDVWPTPPPSLSASPPSSPIPSSSSSPSYTSMTSSPSSSTLASPPRLQIQANSLMLNLHPDVAHSIPSLSGLVWDVRQDPDREGAVRLAGSRHHATSSPRTSHERQLVKDMMSRPALRTSAQSVRIISRTFCWTIDVHCSHCQIGAVTVTFGDIFRAVYRELQKEVTASERRMASLEMRERAEREMREREMRERERSLFHGTLRRVDWLGGQVYFQGLVKDEALVNERRHSSTTDRRHDVEVRAVAFSFSPT